MRLFDWAHRIDLRDEIQEIYVHRFLFQLALGTVTIFLPLYLYENGFALSSIALFFAAFYATFIVTVWPAAHLAGHIGYKHTSFLSSPFILAFYLLMRSLEQATTSVYGIALIGGIGFCTYWIGMNAEMARNTHDDHIGEETGVFFSMPLVASIMSPVVGGLIITVYGFGALFLVATALIAMSYVPFLLSQEHYSGMTVDTGEVFNRQHATDFSAYLFRGATGLGKKLLWPLYIAVVVTGAMNVGGAGSLMALGGTLLNLALGKHLDTGNRGRILAVGTTVLAGTWLLMTLVVTPLHAFVLSLLNGMLYFTLTMPLYTEAIEHAEREDILEYFAFRELALCTGRVVFLLAFVGLFLYLPQAQAFLAGFGITALCTLLAGAYARKLDAR